MRAVHRVLLIGPWRGGRSAGGCCSADPAALSDHDDLCTGEPDEGSAAVAVVRALRTTLGSSVDVQLVDPRNSAFVLPVVYRDARRYGAGVRAALVEAVRATTPWTMVVDGRVVSRAVPLTPAAAVAALA